MKRSTFKLGISCFGRAGENGGNVDTFFEQEIDNLVLNIFNRAEQCQHQTTIRNYISYKFIGLSDGDHKWRPVLVTDHGRHYGSEVGWWLCHSSSLFCTAGIKLHSLPCWTCYSPQGITSVSRYRWMALRLSQFFSSHALAGFHSGA